MPNELQPAEGSGALAQTLSAIKTIPGAVRAIAHVVIGGGKAGAAWIDVLAAKGEQKAQAVRADTKARAELTKALVAEAKKTVAHDEALVRTRHRPVDRRRAQKSRRTARPSRRRRRDDPPAADTYGPTTDFLNLFLSFDDTASSENLQDLFARVLAGEVRKPGSFSLRTLHVVAIMDQHLAAAVQRVRGWVVSDRFVVFSDSFAEGEKLDVLSLLDDVGLLRTGILSKTLSFGERGRIRAGLRFQRYFAFGAGGHQFYFERLHSYPRWSGDHVPR